MRKPEHADATIRANTVVVRKYAPRAVRQWASACSLRYSVDPNTCQLKFYRSYYG